MQDLNFLHLSLFGSSSPGLLPCELGLSGRRRVHLLGAKPGQCSAPIVGEVRTLVVLLFFLLLLLFRVRRGRCVGAVVSAAAASEIGFRRPFLRRVLTLVPSAIPDVDDLL